MGTAAPIVGNLMFAEISGKHVTIRVPSGASGYTSAWQNAFKGYGSNGGGNYVNPNINLVFEYY
jgi:hypothetical protein